MSENLSSNYPLDLDQPRGRQFYWTVATLLIICSVGSVVGRIMQSESIRNDQSVPFFSANDRSRWCTVRSLVDKRTYAIDEIVNGKDADTWDTIDKVRHLGEDGEFHYYSSKPTLLPTLMAGKYWVLKKITGKSIAEHPFFVIRWLLGLTNGLGLLIGLFMLARIATYFTDRLGAALFVLTVACFGTYVTPFAISFNNHLPAAFCTTAILFVLVPVWTNKEKLAFWQFVWVGLFAGLLAAFDLPGLSLAAVALFFCSIRSFSRTVLGFVPAFLLIVAASLGTNYLAHGTWKLAYQHRGDGKVLHEEPLDGDFQEALNAGTIPDEIKMIADRDLGLFPTVEPGFWPNQTGQRWIVNFGRKSQFVVTYDETKRQYEVREWGNWYEFPGSYWLQNNDRKSDVDIGEKDQWTYLFHCTVGHHGLISLTPVWALSLLGLVWLVFSQRLGFRLPAMALISVVVVVFYFYIQKDQHDRNYGGWCSCFRWAIWMYPILLLSMVPIVNAFWKRIWLRGVLGILLIASVLSAHSTLANPWARPWLETWFFDK